LPNQPKQQLAKSLLTEFGIHLFFRERNFVCVKALDLICKSNKKFKITFKKQCKNPETIKRCWKSPGHFWRRVLLIFYFNFNLKGLDAVSKLSEKYRIFVKKLESSQLGAKCLKISVPDLYGVSNSIQTRGMYMILTEI
jgi:hypothetical protein